MTHHYLYHPSWDPTPIRHIHITCRLLLRLFSNHRHRWIFFHQRSGICCLSKLVRRGSRRRRRRVERLKVRRSASALAPSSLAVDHKLTPTGFTLGSLVVGCAVCEAAQLMQDRCLGQAAAVVVRVTYRHYRHTYHLQTLTAFLLVVLGRCLAKLAIRTWSCLPVGQMAGAWYASLTALTGTYSTFRR